MGELVTHRNDKRNCHSILVQIVLRAKASAISNRLRGIEHNAFDLDFWNLPFWYREG